MCVYEHGKHVSVSCNYSMSWHAQAHIYTHPWIVHMFTSVRCTKVYGCSFQCNIDTCAHHLHAWFWGYVFTRIPVSVSFTNAVICCCVYLKTDWNTHVCMERSLGTVVILQFLEQIKWPRRQTNSSATCELRDPMVPLHYPGTRADPQTAPWRGSPLTRDRQSARDS